jgi:hypothetical protein
MPSFFRFLIVVGLLVSSIYAGLYVLAVYLEPPQREITKAVYGVRIRD